MKIIKDPIELLKELEAYLCFRSIGEPPSIPESEINDIKYSIQECLRLNGVDF